MTRSALVLSHHGTSKVPLLLGGALELADRVEQAAGPAGEAVWIRRHWLRGPHLEVGLRTADDSAPRVLAGLRDRAQEVLDAHPSGVELDPEAYAALSERLGQEELVQPPYVPLRPDGTVELVADDPEDAAGSLLEPELREGRESILDAGRDVLRVLAPLPAEERLRAVFCGMVLVADSYDGGLELGYLSFLSHLQDFLHWHDADGTLAARFDQRYQAHAGVFDDLVDRVARRDRPAADPVTAAWQRFWDRSQPVARALAASGVVLPVLRPQYLERASRFDAGTTRRWARNDDGALSPFHRSYRRINHRGLGRGQEFATYRTVVNVFYELLPLLDVAPVERYLLCHALAESVQRRQGFTWQEGFDRSVAAGGAS